MKSKISKGKFRADKIQYPDGIGCCLWYPFDDSNDDCGIAFDFNFSDIDDIMYLLQELKTVEADEYVSRDDEDE